MIICKFLEDSFCKSSFQIKEVETDAEALKVGDVLEVHAKISLGKLTEQDVEVQIYHGMLDDKGQIPKGAPTKMHLESVSDGLYTFAGAISCHSSGRFGYAVRVLPRHKDLVHPFEMRLILWG